VAGVLPVTRGDAVALAGTQPGGGERSRGVRAAHGRVLSRSIRGDGEGAGAAEGAVRFALSDLPSRTRRRCVHVPDAAGTGETDGGPRHRAAGIPLAGEGQRGVARVLRLGGVDS